MEVVGESVKGITERITTEFKGFSDSEIGSQDYADRGAAIEELLASLARLHPRWSAEEEVILPVTEENLPRAGEDPQFWVSEYSEELVRAWQEMNADHPTANSLASGLIRFPRVLSQLCRVTGSVMAS